MLQPGALKPVKSQVASLSRWNMPLTILYIGAIYGHWKRKWKLLLWCIWVILYMNEPVANHDSCVGPYSYNTTAHHVQGGSLLGYCSASVTSYRTGVCVCAQSKPGRNCNISSPPSLRPKPRRLRTIDHGPWMSPSNTANRARQTGLTHKHTSLNPSRLKTIFADNPNTQPLLIMQIFSNSTSISQRICWIRKWRVSLSWGSTAGTIPTQSSLHIDIYLILHLMCR